MCDRREHTLTNQSDSLCDEPDCELTKKGGVWICCICDFGWQTNGPNRYRYCSAGDCVHEDCKTWNAENVALMKATHDAEQEDAANDEHMEESNSSEEELAEDNSDAGKEVYSYEGEAEEDVADETFNDSLYEPSTDDDSD